MMGTNGIYDHFLLRNELAIRLYHEVAAPLPVIDYHNHLNPLHLAENHQFENMATLWVNEDPYKHRATRMLGIPENRITGSAGDFERFAAWASVVPQTLGNPLFHWSCMELSLVFGVDEVLSSQNAAHIWEVCNEKLKSDDFRALALLKRYRVERLCTSDDLLDDLAIHKRASTHAFGINVSPSLRADSILAVDQPQFRGWLEKLEAQTSIKIQKLDDYFEAIQQKLDVFWEVGCALSDHSLDAGFDFQLVNEKEAAGLFRKVLENNLREPEEILRLRSCLLEFLGQEYSKRGWIMQLHIGAQRFTSSRLRKIAGSAGGYAAIGRACSTDRLCLFLDRLEQQEALPKTILYTLNPADNTAFATLTGSYPGDGVRGKIQFGPAWWYNDHYDGIRDQLSVLAAYGLLSTHIGMTTDSRSILSFSRHDYYRRILCSLIGEWVKQERLPNDFSLLKELVEAISYKNIKNWIETNNYDNIK